MGKLIVFVFKFELKNKESVGIHLLRRKMCDVSDKIIFYSLTFHAKNMT